jgi:hypothetical protein
MILRRVVGNLRLRRPDWADDRSVPTIRRFEPPTAI